MRDGAAQVQPSGGGSGWEPVVGGCDYPGCTVAEAYRCRYVDRRRVECGRAGCRDHMRLVDGLGYCMRHASIVEVLRLAAERGTPLQPPDLDSRAASLVLNVSRAVEAGLESRLRRWAGLSHSIFDDPTIRYTRADRGRAEHGRWERIWALAGANGYLLRVIVRVDDGRPELVVLIADGAVLHQEIPPWIIHRGPEWPVPGSPAAEAERHAFHERLLAIVDAYAAQQGLTGERSGPARGR
ncbi:MAG TPA: hypothetical protein VNN74_02495 [Candidatus Micrarchaeia archaeon]|nr:hypothetical protein [Candidatus Micrarchaeia archaeon]